MSIKKEIKRKTLHLSGLLIPVFYFYSGRNLTLLFISISLVAFFIIEPFRVSQKKAEEFLRGIKPILPDDIYHSLLEKFDNITKRLREIERDEERLCIGAHIYFAVGSMITVIIFPKYIAIGAISVAVVSDALAAIVGKNFGYVRFFNGKSLTGSATFFLCSFLILLYVLSFSYNPFITISSAITGSLVGTIVEFYDFPPDDNFSNQIFISLSVYLLIIALQHV